MFGFEILNKIAKMDNNDFGYQKNLSPKDTGGPIVKTGPTAGQNRSRNKDGRWREKRSDAGKSRNNND